MKNILRKMIDIKPAMLAVFAGFFLTASVQAATYTVNSILDPGVVAGCDAVECTLREAIEAANAMSDDDVIEFDAVVFNVAQTITLGGTELTIRNGTLTINGTGANLLTVSGANASRVFYVISATATISGLTVSNGNGIGAVGSSSGGGIYNAARLNLTNSIIRNNSANLGGGIYTLNTINFTNSTVSSNTATDGGGIFAQGSLTNVTVSDNMATRGGGIYVVIPSNILNSTVSNNAATDGGGIYCVLSSRPIITNSTVNNNTATGNGGGIYNTSAVLSLMNSTFSRNSANGNGGGLYTVRPVFAGNSTFSDNSAASGGGIYNNGSANLQNTIIGNSTGGGDCVRLGGTFIATYSLIEDNLTCVNGTNSNNLTGDPNLGPLQNNGGLTFTHALLPGSIAIDMGDSTLTTDQRGSFRPVDDPNSANGSGNLADIGAFEVQAPTAAAVTISGRVSSGKRGLPNAIVHMTDQGGNVRTARTNPFGYFRFYDIEVGQTLIFNVFHKRYQFNPQVISLMEETSELNFTADHSLLREVK